MSRSEGILYPPGEILNPVMGKTDYEYVILWMLNNNDICEWSDFTAEISESTLSGNLKKLMNKGYIEKPEKGKYRITSEGQDRFSEMVYDRKSGKRELKYPPRTILKKRNYDHWILWMLYNNYSCKWSDFKQEPLLINQSSLSNNLNSLIDDGFVSRENKEYIITPLGKTEYLRILKLYDLDRQTILEQESERIEEITEKTKVFFKKYDIKDDELKFRYLDYVLKLSYSKVEAMLKDEEDFNKILLFLSINHPNQYPEFISTEDFSSKYKIDRTTLNYYIREIVDNEFFDIKFFVIHNGQGRTYYFQKNETIEKVLNALVEKHIIKLTYLNKFHKTTTIDVELLLDRILDDICGNLFNDHLKPSLKTFLPGYIRYLAYKIETEKKLVDRDAKFIGLVWKNIEEEFQTFEPSNIPMVGTEDEYYYGLDCNIFKALDIMFLSKLNFLNTKEVQEKYKLNKIAIYDKIIDALYRNKVSKAKKLYQNNKTKLKAIKQLILRDIITTADNDLIESVKITNEIIEKFPNDFIGYLLQSITYFLMDNYERSLEIIEEALEIAPNALIACQKVQILMRTYQVEKAQYLIEELLSFYPDNLMILRAKFINYINYWMTLVKDYNQPLDIINQLLNLNPSDQELLLLKSLYYCKINNYKEAKRLITKEIDINNFIKNPRIDTIAYFILAYSYLARGKFDKSLEIVNLILTLYPNHPISSLTKALVMGYNLIYSFTPNESSLENFFELIKLTISLDPINYNKTSYLVLQSHILNGIGKYDEAIETIDRAIDLVPTSNFLHNRKTLLLITSRREVEALNLIDELLESHPTLKQSLLKQKSYIQVVSKQYKDGLKTVKEGIELDPHDTIFINNKAMILGYLGRKEEAIDTAEYLISLSPRNGNSYDTYGEVLMVLGDYENAIIKLKEALNIEPTGWFAFATCLKLGECFKELGNFEKAIEYYERGIKLTEKMHPSERMSYSEKYIPKAEKMISEIKALLGDSNNNE
ncbi:MAG: tetratricopeptide repeat protein [Candidatus Hodarchaeota archaeon]